MIKLINRYMLLAMLCAVAGFVFLFVGGLDLFLAVGLSLSSFVAFFVFYGKGFAVYEFEKANPRSEVTSRQDE